MSEVIEGYIRRHPDESEKDAFEGFLAEDRIKAWVGADESRKDRLRKEFGRVWGTIHGEASAAAASARAGPMGPSRLQQQRPVRVKVNVEADKAPAAPAATGRKLGVICASCKHMDVWVDGDVVQCRRCHRYYDDMLSLVRVTPVGPFSFLFGEGWRGAATGVGILAGLVGLYYLLRWMI